MKSNIFYFLVLISVLISACASSQPVAPESATSAPASAESTTPPTSEASMSLQLTSDAFVNGQSIPAKYSCIGKNISPALAWTEPPAGTQPSMRTGPPSTARRFVPVHGPWITRRRAARAHDRRAARLRKRRSCSRGRCGAGGVGSGRR